MVLTNNDPLRAAPITGVTHRRWCQATQPPVTPAPSTVASIAVNGGSARSLTRTIGSLADFSRWCRRTHNGAAYSFAARFHTVLGVGTTRRQCGHLAPVAPNSTRPTRPNRSPRTRASRYLYSIAPPATWERLQHYGERVDQFSASLSICSAPCQRRRARVRRPRRRERLHHAFQGGSTAFWRYDQHRCCRHVGSVASAPSRSVPAALSGASRHHLRPAGSSNAFWKYDAKTNPERALAPLPPSRTRAALRVPGRSFTPRETVRTSSIATTRRLTTGRRYNNSAGNAGPALR
jgi:hypothetical protein